MRTGHGGRGVKSLLFMTPRVFSHSHGGTHTLSWTHARGTFPALVAAADLGEFNLGCANFSQRGQGWRWRLCDGVCEWGGAQKENLHCFVQIVGRKL